MSSVAVPPEIFHSAPVVSPPPPMNPKTPFLTIETTYRLPSGPKSSPVMDVKPSMNSVHGPLVAAGSQVTFLANGSTRQIREGPGVNGKPFSSPTYAKPSGPMATEVGTASAGSMGGAGNGRCAVETSSVGNLATIWTRWLGPTISSVLFAASVTSVSALSSQAAPYALESVGFGGWSRSVWS